MTRKQLVEQIQIKRSYLTVGLDTDISKIPKHLQSHPDAIFEFNKAIIDATHDLCVAYKINTAFYEALGVKGWEAMERTVNYIPKGLFKIADAKRGDIGNTSSQYAKAFFETMNFDAITVAPYMGEDSVRPFLEYENKWTIVLGLTSNKGAVDFELEPTFKKGSAHIDIDHTDCYKKELNPLEMLYEKVLRKVSKWGTIDNLMFVIGATQDFYLTEVRKIIPDHFMLVPGVGFQGGSLEGISNNAMNKDCGLLVNASRAIIFAGEKENFAEEARIIAQQYQNEMNNYLTHSSF
jgi:orotidine-5'-phosphate decarboxylase